MSKKCFTDKEVKLLMNNKHVKSVSNKAITYQDSFKELVVLKTTDGKPVREVFEDAGFDIEVIGFKRAEAAASRWRSAYKKSGIAGLKDTRKTNSGRTLNKTLTLAEQNKRLEARLKLLEAENELLKKVYLMERGLLK